MIRVRSLAAVLAVVLLLSACGRKNEVQTTVIDDKALAEYPLKGDITLTCWRQLDANLSTTASNLAESEYSKELEKKTGVKVKYYHPAAGSVTESFNILISSGDLPDLIYYPWEWYPGGAVKAINDGHIIVINDYMEKYAPDYTAYLKNDEEVDRTVRTEKGEYFGFANIKSSWLLSTSAGPMMRKDWLDDLGLEPPETMDEVYTALKAFKEQKNASLPYSGNLVQAGIWGIFTSAYGVLPELYVDNDKVVYGGIKPEYKDYLTTMNKWYTEKLIDNSFPTLDAKTINSNMLNEDAGMTTGAGGSAMGVYLTTMKDKDPKFDLVGLKVPVLSKGETPMYGHISARVSGHYVAITNACKSIEAAMRYLNYNYTNEGHMLANFGIEGVSYEMVDGEPVYTEMITDNPDGLTQSAVMAQYMISSSVGGAFIGDERYIMQYYQYDQQKEALKNWSATDARNHLLPNVNLAEDEVSEISTLLTDINTYANSMTVKFIMGTENLDDFDKFVETVKGMGVEKVEKAYTEALQRYYKK